MATASGVLLANAYPCADGKPIAETDWHRIICAVYLVFLVLGDAIGPGDLCDWLSALLRESVTSIPIEALIGHAILFAPVVCTTMLFVSLRRYCQAVALTVFLADCACLIAYNTGSGAGGWGFLTNYR